MTNNDKKSESSSQNIQSVKELLMKYTDPKPEYTGFSAHGLAEMIINASTAPRVSHKTGRTVEVQGKDHEDHDCSMEFKGYCRGCTNLLADIVKEKHKFNANDIQI